MNSTNDEEEFLKNVVKLEIIPSENDDDDNDTETDMLDAKDQFQIDNITNSTNQLNILKYEEIHDPLIGSNYEQLDTPDNLTNREKRKFLRMRGLAYISGSNKCPKLIEARKLGTPCKSIQCAKMQTRHCNEFTDEERKEIFRKFWYEMNWQEKRLYVKGHVIVAKPSRRRIGSLNSRRRNTMKFFLNKNNKNLQVCKTMFASTLAVGETFVREWIRKSPSCYKYKKNTSVNVNEIEKSDSNYEVDDSINESSIKHAIDENPIPIKIPDTITNPNLEINESKSELPKSSSELNVNYAGLSINQRKEIDSRCKPKLCHNNKCQQIRNEERHLIYNQFWFDMKESEKLTYIQKNIEVIRTGPIKPNIMDTYYYFLKISKRRYPVCKKMFLSTLGLVEKVVEIICDEYKKYLMNNSDEPVEEEDDSDDDNVVRSKNTKSSNDPLDVNIEYIDVYGDVYMENSDLESNCNFVEMSKTETNDSEMDDNISNKDSDQSSWKNDSENDDNEFNEDEDIADANIIKKSFTTNNKEENKKTYSTRSSNRILSTTKINDSDGNFSNNYTGNNTSNKCKITKKETIQANNFYFSNGIIIPPEIGLACKSTLCKKIPNRMCCHITEEQRNYLFKYFWNEMSLTERKQYVRQNIEKFIEFKLEKYKYNLIISNEKFSVCKTMFLNTLCLHSICIKNWLNNIENYDYDLTNDIEKKSIAEMRKANNRMTENTMEKFQILDDFLDSIPKIPPKTFCTQKGNKIYFNENIIGTRILYHMYTEQMKEDGIDYPLSKKNLVKRLSIKNLTFYKGKKLRQGKIDDDIKISNEEKENLKRGQQEKYRDKALARKSPSTILLNIDSFKVKMSPNIKYDANQTDNSNTRLCCYNFIVSNILTLHGMCYWFCETDASNTNNSSFITCLYDYLNNFCKNSQQIIIYSQLDDSRFKNIDMSNALLDYSIQMKKIIIQKFIQLNEKLETECDTIYNSIERKLKTFEIILPSDYVTASIDARRDPCDAKWMNFRVFKDFSVKSQKHRYYKLESSDGDLIDNFHAILYKDNGEIMYKNNFDDEWLVVQIIFKRSTPVNDREWPQLYLERRKISAVKYQSLQSLKVQLPRDCHFFYDYLTIEI